jgi:hypothetical protein
VRVTGPAEAAVDRPFGSLLDAVARPAGPGGGSVAAMTAAGAAALVERCAVAAGGRFDAERARAASLRALVSAIADDDAAALAALARGRGAAIAAAAALASGPPERLRAAASEIASLAALLERSGAPALRGEARCALLLADAVVRAAEAIIAINDGAIRAAADA